MAGTVVGPLCQSRHDPSCPPTLTWSGLSWMWLPRRGSFRGMLETFSGIGWMKQNTASIGRWGDNWPNTRNCMLTCVDWVASSVGHGKSDWALQRLEARWFWGLGGFDLAPPALDVIRSKQQQQENQGCQQENKPPSPSRRVRAGSQSSAHQNGSKEEQPSNGVSDTALPCHGWPVGGGGLTIASHFECLGSLVSPRANGRLVVQLPPC